MVEPGRARDGESGDLANDDSLEAEEQLALAEGEERLPWLESDEDEEEPGADTGRIIAFAAIGLLALVLILGALMWFIGGRGEGTPIADGSTIEAPDEPYRTRPDDPGGREVAGTGETSFQVAEGRTVAGRIAGSGDVPAPSIDREQVGDSVAASKPAPAAGVVGVQVGAYASRAAAEAGWSTLNGRIEALQGRNHRVVQGTADSGTIYRLQALAGTVAEAQTLCRTIKSQGGDCQVKR